MDDLTVEAQAFYDWIRDMMAYEADPEAYDEAPAPPEGSPEDYRAGMEQYLEDAGLTEDQIQQVLDQLDEQGDYSADGYEQNIIFVIENHDTTINNTADNSISIEEGAEVHDIHQANDTNQTSATGDGAIAGDEQHGQFQTGDGTQVGDGNSGVVSQGDNSGQQAGGSAHGGDFTTGDGNFDNSGDIANSGVAFGGGSAWNETDQSTDGSTNNSFNQNDVANTNDSYNVNDSGNYDATTTHESTYNAEANVELQDSFQVNVDNTGYGTGHDGYEADEAEEYVPETPTYEHDEPEEYPEPEGYGHDEPEEYVPTLPDPVESDYEQDGYEDPHCEPEEEPAEYLAES